MAGSKYPENRLWRNATLLQKLQRYTWRDEDTGCHIWTGGAVPRGYGVLGWQGTNVYAHRAAWELAHRTPVRDGLFVCHHCDTPRCCNPAHLFIGTNQDNVDDAAAKGRIPLGVDRPLAKLDPDKVRAIRIDARHQRVIAVEYGVSQALVSLVKLGRIWGHVV